MHLSTSNKSGKINIILAEQGKSVGMTLLQFGATSWCHIYAFVVTKVFDFVKAVMYPSPALNDVVFIRKILLMCPKSPIESINKPVTNAHL